MFLFAAQAPFDGSTDRVAFERKYATRFGFLEHIHGDTRPVVSGLVRRNSRVLRVADFAAAVVVARVQDDTSARAILTEDLSSYFSDVLVDAGFLPLSIEQVVGVSAGIGEDSINRVLLAGCQEEEMLGARVATCVELAANLHTPTEIVFSGRNPGGQDSYLTVDEAAWMQQRFDQLVANDSRFNRKPVTTRLENQSKSSSENVVNFFEQTPRATRQIVENVFIVSSEFHVPRLARIAASYIRDHSLPVQRIVAAGASDLTRGSSRAQLSALKVATHELYRHYLLWISSGAQHKSEERGKLVQIDSFANLVVRRQGLLCERRILYRAKRSVETITIQTRLTGIGTVSVELQSAGTLDGPRREIDASAWTVTLPEGGLAEGESYELRYTIAVDDPDSSMKPFYAIRPEVSWARDARARITVHFDGWVPAKVVKRVQCFPQRRNDELAKLLEMDHEQRVDWRITNPQVGCRYIVDWGD